MAGIFRVFSLFCVLQLALATSIKDVSRFRRQIPAVNSLQSQIGEIISSGELARVGVQVACLPDRMCIAVTERFYNLHDINVNMDAIKLNEDCPGALVSAPSLSSSKMLCTVGGFMSCGTKMALNESHVVYTNTITTHDVRNDNFPSVVIGSYSDHVLPFDCTYPLRYLVSLYSNTTEDDFYYMPTMHQIRRLIIGPSGTGVGEFPVGMFLYENSSYTSVHSASPTLDMSGRFHVGISLLDGPEEAVITVRKCWATPNGRSDDVIRFVLIEDYCPNFEFVSVEAGELSRHFRWSSTVFKFKNSSMVFLHCDVFVCLSELQDCRQCSSRRRRSAEDGSAATGNDAILTVGPVYLEDDVIAIDSDENRDAENGDSNYDVTNDDPWFKSGKDWFFVVSIALVFCFFICLLIVFFIWRNLRRRRQ